MRPKIERQFDNIKSLLRAARHEVMKHEPNARERDRYMETVEYCQREIADLWSLLHSNLYRSHEREKVKDVSVKMDIGKDNYDCKWCEPIVEACSDKILKKNFPDVKVDFKEIK